MVDLRAVRAGVRAPLSCSLGVFALVACANPKLDCEPRAGVHEANLQADNDGDGQVISIDLDPDGTFRSEVAFRDIERDVEVDATFAGSVADCSVLGTEPDGSRLCYGRMTGRWQDGQGDGNWDVICRKFFDPGEYTDCEYWGTLATNP